MMSEEKKENESAAENAADTADKKAGGEEQVAASEGEPAAEPEKEAAEPEKEAAAGKAPEQAKAEPDWKDMYARTLADFDNYRKRTARDREELVKFATSDAVKDMLPTADNLMIALDQAKDKEDPFVKGVRLAYEGFLKSLKDHGAEPFNSVGESLDPSRHEAIATLPSETIKEGRISAEIKRGWMLNGRLLRAAQVVVSSGKGQK
ncbi:MAG: nucleotide exchange factor GrpE [Verrucomicrobiota bacterium]|nr:nucleotide exchange factor GrpE [Verrucomicrobiota bacterium]